MNIFDKITLLQESSHSYQAQRARAQLQYGLRVSEANSGEYDPVINSAADKLLDSFNKNGSISNSAAVACENELTVLSQEAK